MISARNVLMGSVAGLVLVFGTTVFAGQPIPASKSGLAQNFCPKGYSYSGGWCYPAKKAYEPPTESIEETLRKNKEVFSQARREIEAARANRTIAEWKEICSNDYPYGIPGYWSESTQTCDDERNEQGVKHCVEQEIDKWGRAQLTGHIGYLDTETDQCDYSRKADGSWVSHSARNAAFREG